MIRSTSGVQWPRLLTALVRLLYVIVSDRTQWANPSRGERDQLINGPADHGRPVGERAPEGWLDHTVIADGSEAAAFLGRVRAWMPREQALVELREITLVRSRGRRTTASHLTRGSDLSRDRVAAIDGHGGESTVRREQLLDLSGSLVRPVRCEVEND
jgi:hypothetical protein